MLCFCVNTKLPCYSNLCLARDLFLIALLDAPCGRWKGRIMTAVSSTSFSCLLLFPLRNTFGFDYTGLSLSSTSSTSLLFCPCVTFCDDQYKHTDSVTRNDDNRIICCHQNRLCHLYVFFSVYGFLFCNGFFFPVLFLIFLCFEGACVVA